MKMKDEYIIINRTAFEKRIEELKSSLMISDKNEKEITTLEQILSQSTPLIPILEQAYFEGECYGIGTDACINKQDYIVNLKLDI